MDKEIDLNISDKDKFIKDQLNELVPVELKNNPFMKTFLESLTKMVKSPSLHIPFSDLPFVEPISKIPKGTLYYLTRPLEYKILTEQDLQTASEILKQECLKTPEGEFPDKDWLVHFVKDGYAYGLYEGGKLIAVLFAEKLLDKGVFLWYLAVSPNKQGLGYGTGLLKYFEHKEMVKGSWVFLNATPNAEKLWSDMGYTTSEQSNTREFIKQI